jgi:hypothetical protein
MIRSGWYLLTVVLTFMLTQPAGAQTPPPGGAEGPAPLLLIHREEIKAGRAAAHTVNETAWAGAFARSEIPVYWLGMTTIAGPSEAWFLEAHDSLASVQRGEEAVEAHAALRAESDGFAASEADLLTNVSRVIVRYRPALSYQPVVKLPEMRFMSVDMVHVKPGYVADFAEVWREIVAAHTASKMDEHWAVYEVESGMEDGTFLFFYPSRSLAEVDAAGPAHAADAFRDAMGERGRARSREVQQRAEVSSMRYHFRLSPAMSTLPATWAEADPFWNRPAPVATQAGRNDRRR